MSNIENKFKNCLGIELGSTRIKAVVIDSSFSPVSSGDYTWKSSYTDKIWTYDLAEVWKGLNAALEAADTSSVDAAGVSAMMHGYLAFDSDWNGWSCNVNGSVYALFDDRYINDFQIT